MTEPLTTKTRLIGKMLIDWSETAALNNPHIHFDRKLCDGMQNIRFTSDTVNAVFPNNKYDDGYILCYEFTNTSHNTMLSVLADRCHINKRSLRTFEYLIHSSGAQNTYGDKITIREWNISDEADNISQIPAVLDQLFDYELSYFETELKAWLVDHERIIKQFPQFAPEDIPIKDLPQDLLIEGAMRDILTNKYERNRKARARCIAYYGSACMACGTDFGEIYGEKFSGMIHVHHRKPLYEIKEDYVVDPVNDLVPVCPNCHMIIHSKPDGVYTVEEVREMIRNHRKIEALSNNMFD